MLHPSGRPDRQLDLLRVIHGEGHLHDPLSATHHQGAQDVDVRRGKALRHVSQPSGLVLDLDLDGLALQEPARPEGPYQVGTVKVSPAS